MGKMWWSNVDAFVHDARVADDDQLNAMRRWAQEQEQASDSPGTGRNPKARRHFRQMRDAAEQELGRRGLLWGE